MDWIYLSPPQMNVHLYDFRIKQLTENSQTCPTWQQIMEVFADYFFSMKIGEKNNYNAKGATS